MARTYGTFNRPSYSSESVFGRGGGRSAFNYGNNQPRAEWQMSSGGAGFSSMNRGTPSAQVGVSNTTGTVGGGNLETILDLVRRSPQSGAGSRANAATGGGQSQYMQMLSGLMSGRGSPSAGSSGASNAGAPRWNSMTASQVGPAANYAGPQAVAYWNAQRAQGNPLGAQAFGQYSTGGGRGGRTGGGNRIFGRG